MIRLCPHRTADDCLEFYIHLTEKRRVSKISEESTTGAKPSDLHYCKQVIMIYSNCPHTPCIAGELQSLPRL